MLSNYITVKNKNYEFMFYNTTYQINQISPILELKRYYLMQEIKEQMSKIIKKHNVDLDVNNTFPRWFMYQVSKCKYIVDPMITIKKYDFIQIINDIKYFNKNISDTKINNLINDLEIENKCKYFVDEINKLMNSEDYKNNIDNINVDITKNDNFYYYTWKTNNLPFEFTKNIKNFEFKIGEKLYNRMLNKCNMTDNINDYFNRNILCLALRYYTLESYNQQLAVNPDFYKYLKNNHNVGCELFGSSFNTFFDNYCSLYYDLENYFGSVGSFFNIIIKEGFYVANPPFDDTIMLEMSKKFINFMDDAEQNNKNLSILITIPAWTEFEGLDYLLKSKYLSFNTYIIKKKAKYYDYFLDKHIYPCNIHIILIQTKEGKNIHNPKLLNNKITEYFNLDNNDTKLNGKYNEYGKASKEYNKYFDTKKIYKFN